MKQAVLLHGTDGSDSDYYWFADTKSFLESKGFRVWWPKLPNTRMPELDESEEFLEDNFPFEDTQHTIFIAHSSACPLLLEFLSYFTVPIQQAVLVSGFYGSIDNPKDGGISHLMLPEDGFDFEAIRKVASNIVMINSDNDPWGCDDKQARPIAEKLHAKFVLAEGQGHMGSTAFDQPYREFPLLKSLLDV